jgi:predicted dehydrogenase
MAKKKIKFGIIGCGLMGKEFASAAARWCHLDGLDFEPTIIAACDVNPSATDWFEKQIPSIEYVTTDYKRLLEDQSIEAIYCAVPHNLHEDIYIDIIRARKHLLGEKPFGIDLNANRSIIKAIEEENDILVRCSSEFPFFPGAYKISQAYNENRFGQIIEVEAGFWHSSDLNPMKKLNWKRMVDINGEYGCMGDLGMHVLHMPLRFGWTPTSVHALLSNIIQKRPDKDGNHVPCETWDNAILACEVNTGDQEFPMVLSTKRIAPGHSNTWFIRIIGTEFSMEFSTKYPKQIRSLPYSPGKDQAWNVLDVPHLSAYPSITGNIFEFGFSDSMLQMWAAYCDELVNGSDMQQPFYCATPEESTLSHEVFTKALKNS